MRYRVLALVAPLILLAAPSLARRSVPAAPDRLRPAELAPAETTRRGDAYPGVLFASAAATTTVLYETRFDLGASCTDAGWTRIDLTAQPGDFFHVDDFAGLPAAYTPLAGTKSLWCGARPQSSGPLCGYTALPGYGNGWNQAFCTKDCIAVSGDGLLDVSFLARFDSEPAYDATYLQYTLDCSGADGWTEIDGGIGVWDGNFSATIGNAYDIGTTGPVKVRIAFVSDGAWSDEDGLWNTNGAVVIDNLVAENLPLEDFEGEAPGALVATDWQSCTPPGYGNPFALFPGATQVQTDPCVRDLSCLWAAISGSTYNYACGGYPAQTAVPFVNSRGQYLQSEIVSPAIPLAGTGSEFWFEFDVYRDLPLDNLVFYQWFIRTLDGSGCPLQWQDRSFVYYGGGKDWLRTRNSVGDLINLTVGTSVNVALAALDACQFWCGIYGSGVCHSHAPLYDHVKFYRIDSAGPQWSIRDIDQFQDTFAEVANQVRFDGEMTTLGRARADIANDITPGASSSIIPGDSSVVRARDPQNGVASENGRAAVYAYFSVRPVGQPGKSGAGIQAPETRNGLRYPVVDTWTDAGGVMWTRVQMDTCVVNNSVIAETYCVDLNDNLFTPGDSVFFFYSAKNTNGVESYAFGSNLGAQGTDREEAATAPSEFTVLPAGGHGEAPTILYVDGMDGRGAEPYWQTAIDFNGMWDKADRFDVRGPSSLVSNRPGDRVNNVTDQLSPVYRVILWDCGNLTGGLGDGTGSPEKADDWDLINTFLSNLATPGGVYIGGDDVGEDLGYASGVSATTFKSSWLPFNLTTGNARNAYGISPVGTSVSAWFSSEPTFVIYGGCPLINDFDVFQPTGSTTNQITYGAGTPTSNNGALIGRQSGNANILLGGFSLIYIRDDDLDAQIDRGGFLHDVLTYLGQLVPEVLPVAPGGVSSLDQNYPNPCNPQTTIAFSVKERSRVRMVIYNVAGERVRTLLDGEFAAGAHTAVWDGRNDAGSPVSSGVYFYRMVAGDFTQTRKMVLLK